MNVARNESYRADLAVAWPEVERRLLSTLARRGARRDVAQDIAQEVAARVIENTIAFAGADDLLRWCNVTGHRLLVDHHRAQLRWVGEPAHDHAAPLDPSQLAELRWYVGAVVAGVGNLSPADRAALLGAERAPPGDRTGANRLAARRSRARARLRTAAGGGRGATP